MATNAQSRTKTPAVVPLSPDEMRKSLLRPYPTLSLRMVATLLVLFVILAVSWNASRPTAINCISGVGNALGAMFDLVGRMFPPEFELARGTQITMPLLGREIILGWPIIITAVIETIEMAVIGTLGAVFMSLLLSLLAARNTSPHPAIYQAIRLVLNFMRSIPELVYALLFVAAVGLGPFTDMMALAFGSVGSLTRQYAESIEQIDPQQVMALRATGASAIQTFIYAVVPQRYHS